VAAAKQSSAALTGSQPATLPIWLNRQAALTKQAVIKAATSTLTMTGPKNRPKSRPKNRPWSMNETQPGSPKLCFSADSYLVYGIWGDSQELVAVGDPISSVAQFTLTRSPSFQWGRSESAFLANEKFGRAAATKRYDARTCSEFRKRTFCESIGATRFSFTRRK
jgi:hypothetical protein